MIFILSPSLLPFLEKAECEDTVVGYTAANLCILPNEISMGPRCRDKQALIRCLTVAPKGDRERGDGEG